MVPHDLFVDGAPQDREHRTPSAGWAEAGKATIGEVAQPRSERQAEQMEQGEDVVGHAAGVGVVHERVEPGRVAYATGNETPEPSAPDTRLAAHEGDSRLSSQPDYGGVTLGPSLKARAWDHVEAGVPHSGDARPLAEVMPPLLGGSADDQLGRQSTFLSLPVELRRHEFSSATFRRAPGESCEDETPECDPGDPPAYASIEVGPVTEASLMPAGRWGRYAFGYDARGS